MKYYQTELQEIQELQDKIEKLKERVEMVGEGKIDLDDADREDELEMHPRH
jgi:archaellum component FlaC